MTDAVSAGAFAQRDDDEGLLGERVEVAIAIAVVVFMLAFGAWLMLPEESTSVLQGAVVTIDEAVDEATSNTSVNHSTSSASSVAPVPTVRAPAEELREIVVKPLPVVEEDGPMVPVAVQETVVQESVVQESVVQESVVQELAVEQRVVKKAIVEEIVVLAPEPAAQPEPPIDAQAEADLLRRAMSDVRFITGSAVLTQPSRTILDDIIGLMIARPNSALRIVGYTDSQGSNDANARLSFARAEACRDYLLERGLPVGRVNAAGFGERNPIGDNSTAEGRRLNRRVEFELVPLGR